MVSTRGLKPKFVEGERVLCYEPDPTKAKVLYDSKVLDIVFGKDQKGKKNVEYLIHFQGWNSSWDRCVSEEFVLKDTPDNRQLQWDLAEKSQLQLGAYLYRKDRKKPVKKANEPAVAQSSEDGSSGSPARMDTDEGQASSSSEDESSTDGEYIPFEITPNLKELLKNDFYKINNHGMLHNLPCEPNVASILEIYFKHFVERQLTNNNEKTSSRYRNNQPPRPSIQEIHKTILTCREFLDGVRIYFDNYLAIVCLYKEEKGPNLFPTAQAVYPSIAHMNPTSQDGKTSQNKKPQPNAQNGTQKNKTTEPESSGTSRKKSLRSYANQENQQQTSNGNASAAEPAATVNNDNKPCSSVASSSSAETAASTAPTGVITWKALPDFVHNQRPPPPCLVYGATHLTRLMVKIPEILAASTITQEKLKGVVEHLELLIEFLDGHSEWFGDKYYRVA